MAHRPTRLYEAYVFDMDGTIYLGDELLPGAARLITELRRREIPVRFLSNNPTRDPDMYAAKLTRLGLPTGVDDPRGVGGLARPSAPDTIWAERGWTAT